MSNDIKKGTTMHDDHIDQDGKFMVSYELIALLRWLLEHDVDKLKKLVNKAYNSGLSYELQQKNVQRDEVATEDIHLYITDFLSLLDALVIDRMNEQVVQRAVECNLMPTIDHIDSSQCDDHVVRVSVEKATAALEDGHESPRTVLYKELLKQWKPGKKATMH